MTKVQDRLRDDLEFKERERHKMQFDCVRVWRWERAPEEFKALSTHGGDEDWVAHIPAHLKDDYYLWMEDGGSFGCAGVSLHALPDGSQVRIGAHA